MRKILVLLFLLLALHLFFLVNLRFTAWPEMFSFAYLRNHGYLLYRDMIHPYPPILTMILALLYKVFGYHLWVLKWATWTKLLFSDVLIFLIVGRMTKNQKAAIFSVACYVFLQPFLEGNQLWFDLAITTPLLLGFLAVLNKRYVVAGLLFAASGFAKQTGGLFFISYLIWFVCSTRNIKTSFKILLTPLVFAVPLTLRLLSENSMSEFLNWVVIFPSKYWTAFPGYVNLNLDKNQIIILLLLVIPAIVSCIKKQNWLLLLFVIVGLAAIYPRFSFFHFQTVLPFLVISYSLVITKNVKKLGIAILLFLPLLAKFIYNPAIAFEWQRQDRFWSEEYLSFAATLPKGEFIYLLGYHSGNYVLSNTLPPKPWVDNYGWVFEIPGMQEKTIKAWSQNLPNFIVWQKSGNGNWYDIGTYEPKLITDWIEQNYIYKDKNIWQKKD